jgi:uncharacterized protein (DUF1330 family)
MPAYLLVEIDVTDPQGFAEYARDVPALIAAHGGRYIVRGDPATLLEGEREPKRIVVLEFPSMAALNAFWDDPAYQPVKAVRLRTSTARILAVEGAPAP